MNIGKERDWHWDQVKGVLILFVVLGHVIEQCLVGRINMAVYTWIYTFHMPLFVFISGYFTHVKDAKYYLNGLTDLLGQYIVFQVIFSLPILLKGMIAELIIPKYILWYLWCLFVWRSIFFVVDKIKIDLWFVLILAFVVSYFVGYLPLSTEFSFQRIFVFFPYFVIGLIARKYNYVIKNGGSLLSLVISMGILIFAACIILYLDHGVEWWLLGNNNYASHLDIVHRVNSYPIALIMGWAVISICKLRKVKILIIVGKESMFVLIYHAFIIRCGLEVLINRFAIPVSFQYCLFYSFIVVLIVYGLGKLVIFHKLLKPWTLFNRN